MKKRKKYRNKKNPDTVGPSYTHILNLWESLFSNNFRHIRTLFKKDTLSTRSRSADRLEEFIFALQTNELSFLEDSFNVTTSASTNRTARIYYFSYLHWEGRKTYNIKYLVGLQYYDQLLLPMMDDDRVVLIDHEYFTKINFTLRGVMEDDLEKYYKDKNEILKRDMHEEVKQMVRVNAALFFRNKLPKGLEDKLIRVMHFGSSSNLL